MNWMSRRTSLFALLLLSGPACVNAEEPAFEPVVERWGVQEVVFRSDHSYENPFTQVWLKAEFRSGDKKVFAEGFYDGNKTWKVRLMPELEGRWTFRTNSNDALLDQKSGSFIVGPSGEGNHGPIKVVKKYHFSYAEGTPYFLMGTTLYNWLNRDRALEQRTLATLSRGPFNKVRFGIFPKWYLYNRTDPPDYPYLQIARNRFDFDRFDPEFFAHVEERIRDLQRLGIEADVILFHPYDNWGFASMDSSHDEAYIRYVAARLSAFRNVWWTMCNEYNFFQDPRMGSQLGLKPKDWDRLFRVLQSSDPYGHQKAMHNLGAWYDHSKPWITHVSAQENQRLAQLTANGRQEFGKPVVMDELGYEGNAGSLWGDLTAQEVLNRHWDVTMAGGYASHGETYVHPHGVVWWSTGGDLVGESPALLGFLKDIMTAAPFQDLTPSPELVMGGAALAKNGEYYLFRFSATAAEPVQINAQGTGLFKVELIDPERTKVYPLGYTTPGPQAFAPVMATSMLRLTRVDSADAALPIGNMTELLARFVGDTTHPRAPELRAFTVTVEHFSEKSQLNDLIANPRTRAILEKLMPATVRMVSTKPNMGLASLSMLMASSPYASAIEKFSPDGLGVENLYAVLAEISTIPVN